MTQAENILHENRQLTRFITFRYIYALSLIFLMVLGTFFSMHTMIANQSEYATIINISGRQRMLSQRIAFYLNEYALLQTQAQRELQKSKILSFVKMMETAHEGLVRGDPALGLSGFNSPEAKKIYFEKPHNLDHRVKEYLKKVRLILAHSPEEFLSDTKTLLSISQDAKYDLLKSLDHAVKNYEQESVVRTKAIQTLENILFTITVLLLILEVIFIFRPMAAEIVRSHEKVKLANRAKSDFLANMSHEIRTPMNGVLGAASLLQETTLDDIQEKYVKTITLSGRSLLSIINEILDYAKIESGTIEAEFKPLNLEQCVEEQIELLKPLAEEKKLDVRFIYDKKLPKFLISDELRIRKILNNLIGNAIKFTKRGTIVIGVKKQNTAEKDEILFEVSDTGIGVPEEKLDRIFAPFEQVIESRNQSGLAGTGLGLAICKKLLEKIDGEIGCRSKYEEGSVFWFTIPFIPASAEDIEICKENEKKNGEISHMFDAYVLVVEDIASNQFIISHMLESAGCKTDTAQNGAEALKMVNMHSYDLIFMDCNMPIMDGFEATQKIRVLNIKQSPIIALTANIMPRERELCLQAGMDDYMSKPISKGDMVAMLAKWTKTIRNSEKDDGV